MTIVSINGGLMYPDYGAAASMNMSNGYNTDASGEKFAMIGRVYIDNRLGPKTMGGGLSAIDFNLVTATLSTGSMDIGLQDVTAQYPDGTFDTKVTLTGAALTTGWNSKSFASATGTKSIAHGQLVALVFHLVTSVGSNVDVRFNSFSLAIPRLAWNNGTTWSNALGTPLALFTFSDGTLGWFDQCYPLLSFTDETFDNASTPTERGFSFRLPWTCEIDAVRLGVNSYNDPLGDCTLAFYSTPFGTPAAISPTPITINGEDAGIDAVTPNWVLLPSPVSITKDLDYAMAVLATGTGDLYIRQHTAGSAAAKAAYFGNGSFFKKVTRTGSGVFAAESPSLVTYFHWAFRISGIDVSAGGGGGLRKHPGMGGGFEA